MAYFMIKLPAITTVPKPRPPPPAALSFFVFVFENMECRKSKKKMQLNVQKFTTFSQEQAWG